MDKKTFKVAGHGAYYFHMLTKHHLELLNASAAPKHRFTTYLEGQTGRRRGLRKGRLQELTRD